MSVRTQIMRLAPLAAAGMILIAGVFLIADEVESKFEREANAGRDVLMAAETAERRLLRLGLDGRAFLLSPSAEARAREEEQATAADAAFDALYQEVPALGAPEIEARLPAVRASLAGYRETFAALISTRERLG